MVPDLANQEKPENVRHQEISGAYREIAKDYGLCFHDLKPKNASDSNYVVMYHAMNASFSEDKILPEKRLLGGVVCDFEKGVAYAFGEFKNKNSTQEPLNKIPNLDESYLGQPDMEFLKFSLSEIDKYLWTIFDEHNNNGRKSAVETVPKIQGLKLN
ncbi:hypothetical protein GQ473_01665 [archaeon]|nr:hypothetical protein [archaeon]